MNERSSSYHSVAYNTRPGTAFMNSSCTGSVRSLDTSTRSRPITAIGGIGPFLNSSNEKILSSRQVQDENYFIALLQNKEVSIQNEMKRIREQLEILDNDVIALPALKEMHKLGLNEVSSLENTLSDYSLATEKMRCRSDPSEIQSSTRQILIENEALSKEIDELFLQRQKLLREIEQLEKDVNDKHTYLLRFFITSPKREVYLDVLTQMSNCGREKKNLEHLIMNLMEKKRLLLSDCQRSDDHKKEYTDACSEMEKLKTEIKGIDDELIVFQKSPEDALSLLEKRLRDVNARLCDLDEEAVIIDERYQTLLLRMQGLSQRRHELDKDHENTLNLASQYNNLVETEGVYSQQLQEVQAEIGQRSNELHDLKSHVLKLLNNISDIISRFDKAVPTEIEAKKIKAALTFKEKHLVMNVQTLDRLNYQREMRASEVKKSEVLEDKIYEELQTLTDYINKMNVEIQNFDDVQSLQERFDLSNDYLLQMKERYRRRYEFISYRVIELEKELEEHESKLHSNKLWTELRELEAKIQKDGEALYSMQCSIKRKSQETDYLSLSSNCLDIVDALNAQLISYYGPRKHV